MKLPIVPADAEQRRNIFQQLNELEARHKMQFQVFKQWIKCETHLPSDLDDCYLESFLRLCKHDLEKAKKKFERNVILRKGQWHLNYNSFISKNEFQQYDLAKQLVVMPRLTEDGYRVVYLFFPKEATKFDCKYLFKYATTLGDMLFYGDLTAGLICVVDMANLTIEHLSKWDIGFILKYLSFVLLTLPTRLKAGYLLNFPSVGKPLISLILAAMPEKIRSRIFIHKDVVHLKDLLGDEVVPKEYGGSFEGLDSLAKEWEDFYLEDIEWKEKLEKLELRGPVPKAKQHLDPLQGFGVDGSFRNLQVD